MNFSKVMNQVFLTGGVGGAKEEAYELSYDGGRGFKSVRTP